MNTTSSIHIESAAHRTLQKREIGRRRSALCAFAEQIWANSSYEQTLFCISVISVLLPNPYVGLVFFVLFASFMLLYCSDIMTIFTPAMALSLISTRLYSDYGVIWKYWYVLGIFAAALAAHFFLYRAPIRAGEMSKPLLAVSAATVFGGLGKIAAGQYFTPTALYYVMGLGLGMYLIYTLLLSQLRKKRTYDVLDRFLHTLYYAALLSGFVIVWTYIERFEEFLQIGSSIFIQYRNFCATVMLLGLPCIFMPKKSLKRRIAGGSFLYICLLFSGSRSGLFFGALELVAGFVWMLSHCTIERCRKILRVALPVIPVLVCGVILAATALFESRLIDGALISQNDSRYTFFQQGISDFLTAPLFGWGLGNMKNSAIFLGVPGSIVWYHNIIAQVLGSMGLLGAVGYGWLYLKRFRLLIERRSCKMMIACFCIGGMLLIDMTNPGEICPFPSAFIMTSLFAVIELLPKRYAFIR